MTPFRKRWMPPYRFYFSLKKPKYILSGHMDPRASDDLQKHSIGNS